MTKIESLEEHLRTHPDDVPARVQLLTLYRGIEGPDASDAVRKAMFRSYLWLVTHQPDHEILSEIEDHPFEPNEYSEIRSLWLRFAEIHPNDQLAIGKAALNIISFDTPCALDLLTRAKNLDPESSRWHRELCWFYRREALRRPQDEFVHFAELALMEADQIIALKDSWGEQAGILTDMLPLALGVKDFSRAVVYAHRLLEMGNIDASNLWLQYGWLFLAAIELEQNQTEESIRWIGMLLDSLKSTPTHVGMCSQMRNLLDLLWEKGEISVVSQILAVLRSSSEEICEHHSVDDCIAQLNKGQKPNFLSLKASE